MRAVPLQAWPEGPLRSPMPSSQARIAELNSSGGRCRMLSRLFATGAKHSGGKETAQQSACSPSVGLTADCRPQA